MTATIPQQALQCELALSDAILQAARAALPMHPGQWISLPAGARNNESLLALLLALLDAAQVTASAVADNAFDDCRPLPRDFAAGLAAQARRIADDLTNAADAPDAAGWSLPSMSGKELV